jgi:hypothetical protein
MIVCVTGQWFSLDTPVSSTNITDCHDITEILLKVVLNTIHLTQNPSYLFFKLSFYVHVKLHIEHISRFSRKSYMWVGRHLNWWRKLECPEKTTDLSHIMLYRVHLYMSGIQTHNLVIGLEGI